MPMDIFNKALETIDEHYPFSLSPKLILALLVITGICFIILGIQFIWYKRKTTLTASMVGNLSKLIPSLTEKKPSLNSLLPTLSEFIHPTNNKNTNVDTTNAVPQKSSPAYDEQSLPAMVPTNQKWLYHLPKHKLNLYLWNCSTVLLQIWTKGVKFSWNTIKNICLIMNDGGSF